jgi:hypothetical protein
MSKLFVLLVAGILLGAVVRADAGDTGGDLQAVPLGKSAKRAGPAPVEPVVSDGLRIEVMPWTQGCGLAQNGGFLAGFDVSSGALRWLLQVYSTDYDPRRERDVQDVFITALRPLPGGRDLLVEDELGRRFRVDPVARNVQPY